MEQEILNYLTADNANLEVLDNKYKRFYTGVTLKYITYQVLRAKYLKSEVAKTLLKLQKESKIKTLFCNDVNEYVFESTAVRYWSFDPLTGLNTNGYGSKGKNIHEYLKQFIKDE